MNTRILAVTLITTGLGTAALAQQDPAAAEEELAVLPAFNAVDANEDGMIDTAESAMLTKILEEEHRIEFRFDTVDSNDDGLINNSEYVAYDARLRDRLGAG